MSRNPKMSLRLNYPQRLMMRLKMR